MEDSGDHLCFHSQRDFSFERERSNTQMNETSDNEPSGSQNQNHQMIIIDENNETCMIQENEISVQLEPLNLLPILDPISFFEDINKKSSTPVYQSSTYKGMIPIWMEFRKNKELCDCILISSDHEEFHIHRVVLAIVSPFFTKLFTSKLNDYKEEIQMTTFDGKSLRVLIDFAYTGKCKLSIKNVMTILKLSDMVLMVDMIELCCDYIKDKMTPMNCIPIIQFTSHLSCFNFHSYTRTYILKNIKIISFQNEWNVLLECHHVMDYLNDDMCNGWEQDVFNAIRNWVEYDTNNRSTFISQLLNCIRFGFIKIEYFNNQIMGWKCIQKDIKVQKTLHQIRNQIYYNDIKMDLTHPLLRPRIPFEIIFVIYGWSVTFPSSCIETYDYRADRWFIHKTSHISPRGYHFITTVDNKIYMAGGFDGIKHYNLLSCYDPVTLEWSHKAVMHYYRCYIAGCVLDRQIYALGGYNSSGRLSTAERYDVDKNQWKVLSCMNSLRSDGSACTFDGKIYIAGGFNGIDVMNTIEFYDPSHEPYARWITMSAGFKIPRSGLSLVAYRDSLFVLGGFNGYIRVDECEKFTPGITTEWEGITSLNNPRSNFAACVVDDKIYAIGGYNGIDTTPNVECYDGDTFIWKNMASMNTRRSAMGACVVSGIPNIKDYSYLSKFRNLLNY